MRAEEFLSLCQRGLRRTHLLGDVQHGVIIALDLEGRLFAVVAGEVLNRVNTRAITEQPAIGEYLNPGGDGLWPAPEGSCLGYQYATGKWRVPPGLVNARYYVRESGENYALVCAEIDFINASGVGIPLVFMRHVVFGRVADAAIELTVTERFEYLGARVLKSDVARAIPWSLAQFDSGVGAEVVFPGTQDLPIADLYDVSSAEQRRYDGELWHVSTAGGPRYQIGLPPQVPWIEYRWPSKNLRVRRTTEPLPNDLAFSDIADRPPTAEPQPLATRFSVYNDPSGFMEIEASGGVLAELRPGAVSAVTVKTLYQRQ